MQVEFIVVIMAYFLLNIAYSFRLKEVILLDVFLIAAGFMLRVLGGAYAKSVQVSSWIALCSTFISLFLGFAKRRGELVNVEGAESGAPRRVLLLYRVEFLDQMLRISAAGAVIAYAPCTVAPRTVATFGTENLIYTTIFVIYAVFRYLYLIHSGKQGENPTNALTSDVPMIVNRVLWVLSCVYLIYIGGGANLAPKVRCGASLLTPAFTGSIPFQRHTSPIQCFLRIWYPKCILFPMSLPDCVGRGGWGKM
jgi:4-hydroxybenzoate polyprenyltransferase